MQRKHHLRTVRNKTSRKLDLLLLGLILLVAAVLRLWKLGQIPFMHDEFSALFRLRFDTFRELIRYGVAEGDSHPAGVQVFLYYWTKLVGWNAFWVKLPFALMGIASVFLIYVVGKQWFNRKVGLLGAAIFAVSQFTVFYSQLARPYAAGLFFVLLTTCFWNKILFDTKKPAVGTVVGFAVSAWLAALAHNFSAAQAGLIFLTGLFFLKKERRLAYWLGGADALLLYAPHLPVFYQQTFVNGGIGGWLAKPELSFLPDFFRYTMNYAPLFLFAAGFLVIFPFILQKPEKRRKPIRWAPVAWFIIVFALAFVYSLLREPIIQYSTMLFCYPFFVLAALSFYRNNTMTRAQTAIAVTCILFIGAMTLITNRQHYDLMYHQGYDQIALRMKEDQQRLQGIRFATFTESAKVPAYYQTQAGIADRTLFDYDNNLCDFRQWIEHNDCPLLGFGWTDYANPAWETQAVAGYPWLLHQDTWFTSRYLTLSRDSVAGATPLLHPLVTQPFNFTNMEWGQRHILDGDSLDPHTDLLGIVATIRTHDTIPQCLLVMEVHDKANDSVLLWHGGSDAGTLYPGTNHLVNAIRFDEKRFPPQGKTIQFFIWDQQKGTMIAERFDYYFTRFNRRLTGLYEPL